MANDMSVVIPTVGRSSLARALMSVAEQSHRPHEITVVSNGPAPLEAEQLQQLEDLAKPIPLTVLSLPPMSGPSVSRNLGAWHSSGCFVAFLDDDDEFSSMYLESMHERIKSTDPDVLYGAKVWRGEDVRVEREKRLSTVPPHRWFETLYKQRNPGFGGQNVVVRRSKFFEIGGFPFDLPSGEDRAFAMAALRAGYSVEYVDAAVVKCHDPIGPRSNGRPDKWVTNLKLIFQYWPDVRWGVRLRSILTWLRSFGVAVSRQVRPTADDR